MATRQPGELADYTDLTDDILSHIFMSHAHDKNVLCCKAFARAILGTAKTTHVTVQKLCDARARYLFTYVVHVTTKLTLNLYVFSVLASFLPGARNVHIHLTVRSATHSLLPMMALAPDRNESVTALTLVDTYDRVSDSKI